MSQVWDPLRKKMVALTPEEKVRQWFISTLRDQFNVPEHMVSHSGRIFSSMEGI